MSNSRGSYRTSAENYMKAFDKLPAEVRADLRECHDNYVPQPLLTAIRRGASVERKI